MAASVRKLAGVLLTGAALVAALAGAGPAVAASSSPPVSFSVSPAEVAVAVGQRAYTEHLTVLNTGRAPVLITGQTRLWNDGTCASDGSLPWARLTWPHAGVMLAPGQERRARLIIHAPASVRGDQDVAAVLTAAPGKGTVGVAGAIASRVILRLDGKAAIPRCGANPRTVAKHTDPPAASTASTSTTVFADLFFVALVIALAEAARRGIRRIRRHRKVS